MPRIIDDLKYIAGLDVPADVGIYGVDTDACSFCGGLGLSNLICPGCGKWDHRSDFDIEDEAMMAEMAE